MMPNWKFRFCQLQNDLFNIAARHLPSVEIIPTMSTRSIEYTKMNIETFLEIAKQNAMLSKTYLVSKSVQNK